MKRIVFTILLLLTIINFNTSCKKNISNKVVITASCKGCNVEATETIVTSKIESHLSVFGLKTESVTGHEKCMITVHSKLTLDSIRHMVLDLSENLPEETQLEIMNYVDPNTQIVRYVLSSDQLSLSELRKWNEDVLNKQLHLSPKVDRYYLIGGGRQIIKIEPSNHSLLEYGLGLNDLEEGINEGWMELSSNKITKIEEVTEMVIQQKCMLKDVAEVTLSEASNEDILYNSHPALEGVVIFRKNLEYSEIKKEFQQILEQAKQNMKNISIVPFWAPGGWNKEQLPIKVDVNYPPGIQWEEKKKVNHEINRVLSGLSGIKSVVTETGYSANGDPQEMDRLTIFLNLEVSVKYQDVEKIIMEKLDQIPGIEYSMMGKRSRKAQILIQGNDLVPLIKTAGSVADYIKRLENIYSVCTEGVNSGPQVSVTLDKRKLASLGVNTEEIESIINGRRWENQFGQCWQLISMSVHGGLENFQELRVKTLMGLVPISSFSKITITNQCSSILHVNGKRCTKVSFLFRTVKALNAAKKWVNNPVGVELGNDITMHINEH